MLCLPVLSAASLCWGMRLSHRREGMSMLRTSASLLLTATDSDWAAHNGCGALCVGHVSVGSGVMQQSIRTAVLWRRCARGDGGRVLWEVNGSVCFSLANCLIKYPHISWGRSDTREWREDAGVTWQTASACGLAITQCMSCRRVNGMRKLARTTPCRECFLFFCVAL